MASVRASAAVFVAPTAPVWLDDSIIGTSAHHTAHGITATLAVELHVAIRGAVQLDCHRRAGHGRAVIRTVTRSVIWIGPVCGEFSQRPSRVEGGVVQVGDLPCVSLTDT